MPQYFYRCHDCKADFDVRHGMFFEEQRCIKCHSENVQRVPVEILLRQTATTDSKPTKTGKIVDDYIKETKKEIKKEKDMLRKQEL